MPEAQVRSAVPAPRPPGPVAAHRASWLERVFAPRRHYLLVPVLAVGLALALCFLAIALTGKDPVEGYRRMFDGGLGSLRALGDSSVKASVLILTGLSVAAAFSVGLFNIGAEGQLVVGAIAAAWFGHAVEPGSAIVHVPLALAAAMFGGAAWALVAAWLKVRRGVHEVISTIMLNWVAIHLVESWLVVGPLAARADGSGVSLPGTAEIAPTAALPRFFDGSDLGLGLFLALAAALALRWLLERTWAGFEMRAVGDSREAAEYAAIPVARRTYQAMAIAGACAGLAGAVLVLGVHRQYPAIFHTGYGFDGIAVSLIGGNHPLGVVLSAAFFGILRAGGTRLQLLQIHRSFPELIQGLALLLIAGQLSLRGLLQRLGRPRRPPTEVPRA